MTSTGTRGAGTIADDEQIPGGVVLRPAGDIVEHEFESDIVLYHPRRGTTHVLNETAAVVWWLCDGQRNVGDVIARMAELYRVHLEAVAGDVDEILTEFMLQGLIE